VKKRPFGTGTTVFQQSEEMVEEQYLGGGRARVTFGLSDAYSAERLPAKASQDCPACNPAGKQPGSRRAQVKYTSGFRA
jgi:hypothetical protein